MMNKEEFVNKSNEVHSNKYDYSKVEYVNSRTKVCIICPTHGEFLQIPKDHLRGRGCNKCGKLKSIKKRTSCLEEFVLKANKIYGNKYDYSKVNYINAKTKVCIICPEHGEFWQSPNTHLRKHSCPNCGLNKISEFKKNTTKYFIKKSNEIHNNKYCYSKVNYITAKTKVCIICPEHGEFWQAPDDHMHCKGCPKCAKNYHFTTEELICKFNKIHKDRYNYSKVKYVNYDTKVCIICPEHGEFLQSPYHHLIGCNCPKCNSSYLENEVRNLLVENGIDFEEQKKFDWLGRQSLDFYLPNHNIAIECQGIQHFEPIEHFGGKDALDETVQRDKTKKQLCDEHNIRILYYANYDYDFPYKVYTNKEKIISDICQMKK